MTHTLSEPARAELARFAAADRSPWRTAPGNDREWRTLQDFLAVAMEPSVAEALARFEGEIDEITLGGLAALRLRPAVRQAGRAPLAFIHGGGYTVHSARTTLPGSLALARTLQREVVALDYPLAPGSTVGQTVPRVAGALTALMDAHGPCPLSGDSAGGGLALAATLDLARQERALPTRLALISPWTDLTETGDSRELVRGRDPVLEWDPLLAASARAYAGKHPARPDASPVNADYDAGFPPTLVLVGTREILLSDALRLHDRLEQAGVCAALQVYDGLYHAFPVLSPDIPEAEDARRRIRTFLEADTDTAHD